MNSEADPQCYSEQATGEDAGCGSCAKSASDALVTTASSFSKFSPVRDAMTCKLDYLVGAGGERTNLILAGADNFIQTVSNTAYKWNFTFPNSNHLADIVSLTELGSGTTVASTKLQYDSLGRLKQVTVTNMKNPMMPVSMTTNLPPN